MSSVDDVNSASQDEDYERRDGAGDGRQRDEADDDDESESEDDGFVRAGKVSRPRRRRKKKQGQVPADGAAGDDDVIDIGDEEDAAGSSAVSRGSAGGARTGRSGRGGGRRGGGEGGQSRKRRRADDEGSAASGGPLGSPGSGIEILGSPTNGAGTGRDRGRGRGQRSGGGGGRGSGHARGRGRRVHDVDDEDDDDYIPPDAAAGGGRRGARRGQYGWDDYDEYEGGEMEDDAQYGGSAGSHSFGRGSGGGLLSGVVSALGHAWRGASAGVSMSVDASRQASARVLGIPSNLLDAALAAHRNHTGSGTQQPPPQTRSRQWGGYRTAHWMFDGGPYGGGYASGGMGGMGRRDYTPDELRAMPPSQRLQALQSLHRDFTPEDYELLSALDEAHGTGAVAVDDEEEAMRRSILTTVGLCAMPDKRRARREEAAQKEAREERAAAVVPAAQAIAIDDDEDVVEEVPAQPPAATSAPATSARAASSGPERAPSSSVAGSGSALSDGAADHSMVHYEMDVSQLPPSSGAGSHSQSQAQADTMPLEEPEYEQLVHDEQTTSNLPSDAQAVAPNPAPAPSATAAAGVRGKDTQAVTQVRSSPSPLQEDAQPDATVPTSASPPLVGAGAAARRHVSVDLPTGLLRASDEADEAQQGEHRHVTGRRSSSHPLVQEEEEDGVPSRANSSVVDLLESIDVGEVQPAFTTATSTGSAGGYGSRGKQGSTSMPSSGVGTGTAAAQRSRQNVSRQSSEDDVVEDTTPPDEEPNELCPICQEDMEPGLQVQVLPGCHHTFHPPCIQKWFEVSKGKCPVCKADVMQYVLDMQGTSAAAAPRASVGSTGAAASRGGGGWQGAGRGSSSAGASGTGSAGGGRGAGSSSYARY